MLNVYFGNMPDAIYNTSSYFKYNYEREWITDPSVVKMKKILMNLKFWAMAPLTVQYLALSLLLHYLVA